MPQAPKIPAKPPPKPQKTQATLQKFFVCHTDEFCYIDKVLVILSEAKYP